MLQDNGHLVELLTPSGLKLCIHDSKVGEKVCIFIHGLADGSFVWHAICNEMGLYFRTISIDLRGHGDSDWDTKKNYDLDNYVADVEFVLDHFGLQQCVFVGHSFGGSIVAQLMERRPRDVLGVVLVDSGPLSDLEINKYLKEQILESYRTYDSVSEYSAWLLEKRPFIDQTIVEQLAQNCLRPLPTGGFRPKFDIEIIRALNDDENETWWWAKLETFRRPILLIRGIGSAILSRGVADKMVRIMPNGALVTVEFAGHAVMSDNPDGFLKAIKAFLLSFCRFH